MGYEIIAINIYFSKISKSWRVRFKIASPFPTTLTHSQWVKLTRESEAYQAAFEFCSRKNRQLRIKRVSRTYSHPAN